MIKKTAGALAVNKFLCSGIGNVNTIFVGVSLKKKTKMSVLCYKVSCSNKS